MVRAGLQLRLRARGRRGESSSAAAVGRADRPAFSLVEVLLSVAIISLLIALMLPMLSGAAEQARRVRCRAQVSQLGIALQLYADDWNGLLPPTTFVGSWRGPKQEQLPEQTVRLRLEDTRLSLFNDKSEKNGGDSSWDGLGRLYNGRYIGSAKAFFCPSHHGNNPFRKYEASFGDKRTDITGNFQFRGVGPAPLRTPFLEQISPRETALITDSIRSQADYNHRTGLNVLRADGSLLWFDDGTRKLGGILPVDDTGSANVDAAWGNLDQFVGVHR